MDSKTVKCNNSYIPSTAEYMEALGPYGASVMVIGALISVGLYILFFEQVFYTQTNAHRIYRRHIFWISSVYPLMAALSVLSLLVPRANDICTAVKITYMSVGISHFTDLTLLMFGGEEVMLQTMADSRINLQVGPVCCCCLCLPSPPVSKFSLRLVVMLSDQLPFTQALYYFLILVLLSANNITIGSVNWKEASLYLYLFDMASFMSGVYALSILTYVSKGHLEHYSYKAKSFSMNTLVLITNMQGLAFDIMGNYNAFPCIPPYLSPQVYKQTVENSIYLLEMMVLGSYTYWHYHNQQFRYRPATTSTHSGRPVGNTRTPGWGSAGTRVGRAQRLREDSISSTSTQSTVIESGDYREGEEEASLETITTLSSAATTALATRVSGSRGSGSGSGGSRVNSMDSCGVRNGGRVRGSRGSDDTGTGRTGSNSSSRKGTSSLYGDSRSNSSRGKDCRGNSSSSSRGSGSSAMGRVGSKDNSRSNSSSRSNSNIDNSNSSTDTKDNEAIRSSLGYTTLSLTQHSRQQSSPHEQNPSNQGNPFHQKTGRMDVMDGASGDGGMSYQANVLSFPSHHLANLSHGDVTGHLVNSRHQTPRCQRSTNEQHTSTLSNEHRDTSHCSRSVTQHDADEGVALKISVQGQDYFNNPQAGSKSRVVHLHQPPTVPGSQLPHQPVILLHRPSDEEIDV